VLSSSVSTWWRRREGVEPSADLAIRRLVLKTSGATGHLPSPLITPGALPRSAFLHCAGRKARSIPERCLLRGPYPGGRLLHCAGANARLHSANAVHSGGPLPVSVAPFRRGVSPAPFRNALHSGDPTPAGRARRCASASSLAPLCARLSLRGALPPGGRSSITRAGRPAPLRNASYSWGPCPGRRCSATWGPIAHSAPQRSSLRGPCPEGVPPLRGQEGPLHSGTLLAPGALPRRGVAPGDTPPVLARIARAIGRAIHRRMIPLQQTPRVLLVRSSGGGPRVLAACQRQGRERNRPAYGSAWPL